MGTYILFCLCFITLFGLITAQDAPDEGAIKTRPVIYKLHINSDIRYRYAKTNVISQIANSDNVAKEIFFKVTLPKAAFITYFDMTIDGVVYPGEVKEKEKAKKQYEQAVSRGESAGQVAQQARDSNVFKVSVNVAAGKKVFFNLTYEELLERKFGKYQHVINIDPGQVIRDLRVNVNIQESRDIVHLRVPDLRTSSSKAISQTENPLAEITHLSANHSVITYQPSQEVQKNFSDTGLSGQFVVQYDVIRDLDGGEIQVVDGYFVHYFAPQGLPPVDKNVLFILDASGSMNGRKIEQVKEAMETILKDLKPTDKFGIVSFETSTKILTEELLSVTPENIKKGLDMIRNQYHALGGTNINDAVLDSIKYLSSSGEDEPRPSIIIFLTDGEANTGVSNTVKIAKNVASANEGRYALFSLGFGFSVDYPFLQKMSLQNNGFARKIYEDADSTLQLEGFYKEVSTPVISDVNITYLDNVVDPSSLTTTSFSNYFDGSEIVVAGRLVDDVPDIVTCVVKGTGKNGNLSLGGGGGVEAPRSDLSRFTERMWAYLSIKKLIKEMDLISNATLKEEVKNEALDLSLKYGFVTPLTSMVVTKPESDDNTTSQVSDLQDADNVKKGGISRRQYSSPGRASNLMSLPPQGIRAQPGPAFTSKRGFAPSYDLLVDSDPHMIIPVSGIRNPLCYDVDGNNGDVFRLLQDKHTGLVVNGQIVIGEPSKPTKKKPSYFGQISILSPTYKLIISPWEIRINNKKLVWKISRVYRSEDVTLRIDSGRRVNIAFGDGVELSVLRHIKQGHKTDYLGFYLKNGSGLSTDAHGLIGQFLHQSAHTEHSDSQLLDGVPTTIVLKGPNMRQYKVEARLGSRRNEETNSKVMCWHIRNNGRGLVEGTLRDYIVPSLSSRQ